MTSTASQCGRISGELDDMRRLILEDGCWQPTEHEELSDCELRLKVLCQICMR